MKSSSASTTITVTGTACVTLEINQPGSQDNYLSLSSTGTLTVGLPGGDSGTNYTVALTCAGSGSPSGNVAFSSTSVTVQGGGSQTVTLTGQAIGGATITGTASNAASGTVNATVVQLASVTVASGATQTNVTGVKNWAAVKSATGNVTVQAKLSPDVTPAGPASLVTWTGGNAVSGQLLQNTVPLAVSASTEVTASCGGTSDHVDVWVLWATIVTTTTGSTPPNAVQYGKRFDETEILGARLYSGSNIGVGKVIPVATLSPAGVNAVVQAGWNINREMIRAEFNDGLCDTNNWDSTWQLDSSFRKFQRLTPDAGDQIYDEDAPNIGVFDAATDSSEVNDNFREWVTWNGTSGGNDEMAVSSGTTGMCSDYAPWCWQARAKKSATPNVTYRNVSVGSLSLPGSNGSYYKRISGAVTIAGNNNPGNNGLEGVTVSAPCTSDAANTIGTSGTVSAQTDKYTGEFTILTVPPGSCTLAPTLTGYTFNPPSSTLTVPTTGQVTGANFTATKSP